MASVTTTDLTMFNLLEEGVQHKAIKKAANIRSQGNMEQYLNDVSAAKRNYKKSYRAYKLENLGYLPESDAISKTFNENAVISYIQNVYDFSITSIIYTNPNTIPTLLEVGIFELQSLGEWNPVNWTITEASVVYGYTNTTIGEDGDTGNPTIQSLLTASDGSTITRQTSLVLHSTYGSDSLIVQYNASGGAIKYFVEGTTASHDAVYDITTLAMSSIIALKENNVINPLDGNLKRMLKLLNIEHRDLEETLENEDVDNAYIFYGLPLNVEDSLSIGILYETFKNTAYDGTALDIELDDISFSYTFEREITTLAGTIGEVDDYTSEITTPPPDGEESGLDIVSDAVLTLQKQVSVGVIEQIEISEYVLTVSVNGSNFRINLEETIDPDNDAYNNRLLLPLDALQDLRYNDFRVVHEQALTFIAYSSVTTQLKWYETGWFKVLLFIVVFVVSVLTMGLPAAALSTILSTAVSMVLSGVLQILDIGGWLGQLITIVLAIVSLINGNLNGFDLYYRLATEAIKVSNVYTSYKQSELMKEVEDFTKTMEEATEELEAIMEEEGMFEPNLNVSSLLHNMDFATQPFSEFQSTESFVYEKTEQIYATLENIFEIDPVFEQKVNIYSGI